MTEYPRDLCGYGQQPPAADWPGGARIAVQFVINYEEGAENCVLHGDAASEAFLSEIVGASAIDGQRHMNMESSIGILFLTAYPDIPEKENMSSMTF